MQTVSDSFLVCQSARGDLAGLEGKHTANRAVKIVLQVENTSVTVLTDSILYLSAELEEVIATLEQEAK